MRADIHPKYEKLTATCSCGKSRLKLVQLLVKMHCILTSAQLAIRFTPVSKSLLILVAVLTSSSNVLV